jgi:hypothetical protein
MKRPTLESRRERVRRVNRKRPRQEPAIVAIPTYRPSDEARERLICVLVDILTGTTGR